MCRRQQWSVVTANLSSATSPSTHNKDNLHTSNPSCLRKHKIYNFPTYFEYVGQAEWQHVLLVSLCLCRFAHSPVKRFELWPVGFFRASSRTRHHVALLLHGVSWLLDRCLMTASLVTPVASLVGRLPPSPWHSRSCECVKSFEYFVLNSIWEGDYL